jgi:outer membrane protein W
MKVSRTIIPVALALCFGTSLAHAQAGLSVYFGVGTAVADSSKNVIDTFGTGNPLTTPRLGGTFGKAGLDYMFSPHFGVGAETDFRFSQGSYAGLTYRPTFYDFNLVYKPIASVRKRVIPEFQGGLGAANMSFYVPNTSCNQFTGCSSNNTFLDSSNHFQVHTSAGVRFYATSHLFIRPQVDVRYIHDNFQFGTNWVPEYGAAVGWTFGER